MSRPPSSNGKRFGSKNGNMSFLTVSICNSRKKVKRDVVMNVEITDNSKEVSGAIHQVGQAIADTGAFCKPGKSQQQGLCMEQWSFSIPEGSCGHCSPSAYGGISAARPQGCGPLCGFAASRSRISFRGLVLLLGTIQNGYFLLHGHSGTGTIGAAYQQGGVCHE